jgi:hypothetical protein
LYSTAGAVSTGLNVAGIIGRHSVVGKLFREIEAEMKFSSTSQPYSAGIESLKCDEKSDIAEVSERATQKTVSVCTAKPCLRGSEDTTVKVYREEPSDI